MRTRILEKQTYFSIGDVEFYIPATAPFDFGKVTANTSIKLTQAVSKSEQLQRVTLVPLKRQSNSREELLTHILQPFF